MFPSIRTAARRVLKERSTLPLQLPGEELGRRVSPSEPFQSPTGISLQTVLRDEACWTFRSCVCARTCLSLAELSASRRHASGINSFYSAGSANHLFSPLHISGVILREHIQNRFYIFFSGGTETLLLSFKLLMGSWVSSWPLIVLFICRNDWRPYTLVRFADTNSTLAVR